MLQILSQIRKNSGGYAVVRFFPWLKAFFLFLFSGIVVYDNDFKTKLALGNGEMFVFSLSG